MKRNLRRFKKDYNNLVKNDLSFNDIKDKIDYKENKTRVNTFSYYAKRICFVTLTILLVFCLGFITANFINKKQNKDFGTSLVTSSKSAVRVKNISELKELLGGKENSSNVEEDVPVSPDDSDATNGSFNNDHYYVTNNQVAEVEEADIIKVDKETIYYATSNSVVIVKVKDNKATIVKTISFIDTADEVEIEGYRYYKHVKKQVKNIYITSKYLVVNITSKVNYEDEETSTRSNYKIYTEYNIYDKENYEEKKNFLIPGYNVSSRIINDKLYVINNYTECNNVDSLLPIVYIDDDVFIPSLNRIWYLPSAGLYACKYSIIFTIELKEKISYQDYYFLTPTVNFVYVSLNNIYLVKNKYDSIEKDGYRYYGSFSQIFVINIGEELTFDGAIKVPGEINNQYFLDEYNGYLRFVTTGSYNYYKTIDNSFEIYKGRNTFNHLYIYKKTKNEYKEISSIKEGIGKPNELVKSVRFNKDLATIVTFVNTDPLYYIDLSNPQKPNITSELERPGYSVYQHPYLDKYMIGFGYEVENNITIGYKISLFDVSDKNNIKEVGSPLILKNQRTKNLYEYYYITALSNPLSIMFDLTNNIFGLAANRTRSISTKYVSENLYLIFEINPSNQIPITIKETITIDNLSPTYYDAVNSNRMVFIGNNYYLFTVNKIIAFDYKGTFNKIDTIYY